MEVVEELGRPWRGVAPDERVRDRRARLLDAGFALATSDGVPAVSVRAVCAAAGLTSRYFYESFADRDALLGAVYDGLVADAVAAAGEAALADGDLRARVHAALTAAAGYLLADRRRVRFLLVEAAASPALDARRRELVGAVARAAEAMAVDTFGLPVARRRVLRTAARFVVGGLVEIMAATLEGELALTVDELVDDTTDIVVALAEAAAHARPPARRPPKEPLMAATPADDLPRIGAPATRALAAEGITRLDQLPARRAADLARLHGVGPKAIRLLREALAERGQAFADD